MACAEEELHYNDTGTLFLITINDCVGGVSTPMDLATASSMSIVLKSPSGISSTKTATLNSDGTDGKIEYTTVDGDLNEVGTWRMQAIVNFPTTSFRSNIKTFRVYENL